MSVDSHITKFSNDYEGHYASLGESSPEKRAKVGYWLDLGHRIVVWVMERLQRRRSERNKSRLSLADIAESDLSELGCRIRREVLRECRDLEYRKHGN